MSLSTITGSVKDLTLTGITYEDVVFNGNHKSAAAVGAAIIGEFASSAILASSVSSSAEIAMKGFNCTINGTTVRGAFYKVGFVEGETIEFVGEEQNGDFITVAARSPSQRTIWTIPYHERGHVANRRNIWKWGSILSLFFAFLVTAIGFFIYRLDPVPMRHRISPPAIAFFSGLLINYWVRSHFTGFCRNATLIFEALGYPKPAEVDLRVAHKIADENYRKDHTDTWEMYTPWCYRY